jgi:oxygen-independent coproporphyrinogen-3 oxidase
MNLADFIVSIDQCQRYEVYIDVFLRLKIDKSQKGIVLMDVSMVKKYSASVPRYTSYPTAPHFVPEVDGRVFANWLSLLGEGDHLSLYIHIPFCDRLCWFCACHTKHTLKYEPIDTYLKALHQEILIVSQQVSCDAKVTAIHWGGGSPTMLKPADMNALMAHLRDNFDVLPDAEISVEMDPNDLDEARYDALAQIGVTRASLGVQDFDERVQAAINRPQSFDQTKSVVDSMRARGVQSVNCDILYGLPHQTLATMEETVRQIISLNPDRIALFGYAHVPWMKKHQSMIDEAVLPDAQERLEQMQRAADMLIEAGYQAIGIDHFALPDDQLAIAERSGTLARNFQGYTTDRANALIGLGASSISQLPQGYSQNMPATAEYQRLIAAGSLSQCRGIELSADDKARAWLIAEIMCFREIHLSELEQRFGAIGRQLAQEMRVTAASDTDGLIQLDNGVFSLSQSGKTYARVVASYFDAYLSNGRGRHSAAV